LNNKFIKRPFLEVSIIGMSVIYLARGFSKLLFVTIQGTVITSTLLIDGINWFLQLIDIENNFAQGKFSYGKLV